MLNRVGSLLHFPISKDLPIWVKRASDCFQAYLKVKKAAKQVDSQEKAQDTSETQARNHKANCNKLELKLRPSILKVAESNYHQEELLNLACIWSKNTIQKNKSNLPSP